MQETQSQIQQSYSHNTELQCQMVEIFKEGKLIKFNSTTDQNGKNKYVNIKLENEKFIVDGSSNKGEMF